MTAVIGVNCVDGVVVGADGSVTFVADQQRSTIEQPTKKIKIIHDRIIVTGSGSVGYQQRLVRVVTKLLDGNDRFHDNNNPVDNNDPVAIGELVCRKSIENFQRTYVKKLDYSALIAFPAGNKLSLCEFPGDSGFQPELKLLDDGSWYVSMGSGQYITDPFLAFLRSIFWKDGAPTIRGGVFTVLWALLHACEVNPGGINEPITLAVLRRTKKGKILASELSSAELAEYRNIVDDAEQHIGDFRDVLLGRAGTREPPRRKIQK